MNPLQVFPRHPSAPDTYYINGAWAPAAITAAEKRFTDAELAAEYWEHRYGNEVAVSWASDYKIIQESRQRLETIGRFARLPHHDDGPA